MSSLFLEPFSLPSVLNQSGLRREFILHLYVSSADLVSLLVLVDLVFDFFFID